MNRAVGLRLDFDTCKDNKSDEHIKKHLKKISGEILNSLGPEIVKSIILIGSMTRGEASAISDGEKIEVFSDYDILVLVNKATLMIYKKLRSISVKLTEEFSRDKLPSHVDISPMSLQKLTNVKATMFTLELKEYGRSLYGEDHREYTPDLKPEDIPPQDSLRMLHNRIAGVLDYFNPAVFLFKKKDEPFVKFLIYHIVKNIIDLGSSLLSFEKMYVCSYKERVKVLKENFEKFDISEECPRLPEIIEKWGKFKLKPDIKRLLQERGYNSFSYENIVELAKKLWFEHIGYMEAVWKYEVQRLYGTQESDTTKLIDIYFTNNNIMPLQQRLRTCHNYINKSNGLLQRFYGCIKSLRGYALSASIYSLSNLIFFYAPIVWEQRGCIDKASISKYMQGLPIHLSLQGDDISIWNNLRKEVVVLWRTFLS